MSARFPEEAASANSAPAYKAAGGITLRLPEGRGGAVRQQRAFRAEEVARIPAGTASRRERCDVDRNAGGGRSGPLRRFRGPRQLTRPARSDPPRPSTGSYGARNLAPALPVDRALPVSSRQLPTNSGEEAEFLAKLSRHWIRAENFTPTTDFDKKWHAKRLQLCWENSQGEGDTAQPPRFWQAIF